VLKVTKELYHRHRINKKYKLAINKKIILIQSYLINYNYHYVGVVTNSFHMNTKKISNTEIKKHRI